MAVVSQPFDRGCQVPAPGTPDSTLGEFWEDDPWQIMVRHNQSAFERNRAYLNLQGENFVDVSYLTGADTDADSRAVVAGDFDNDGRMDLIVRGVGGGPLSYYENNFPPKHFLKVSLWGTKSNRLGIGARLTAWVGNQPLVRELYPANTFMSQLPSVVHFGLGDAEVVGRLEIRWPSGTIQELKDVAADQHILVREGVDGVETMTSGETT